MLFPKHSKDLTDLFFNIPLPALATAVFLFLCLNLFLYYDTHGMQVEFEVKTNTPETLQFYWRNDGQEYNEKRSVKVNISPEKTAYSCFLSSSSRIDKIRLDPADKSTEFLFKNLVLKQRGFSPVILFSKQNIPILNNLYQISSVEPVKEGGIIITTSGKDPRIEISISTQYKLADFFYLFIILFLLCSVTAIGTLVLHYFFHPVLLRGRLDDGQITLTFPLGKPEQCAERSLALLQNKCKNYKILSVTEREGLMVYQVNFSILSPDTLTELLRELQILCPDIRCQVFYNRSGEV
jgi:hypothetical protein